MATRREPAGTTVDAFLAAFSHPMREQVLALRAAILAANPTLTEHIKWSAPSFCHDGDDRVTFRFAPKGSAVQLIFHRGAKAKAPRGFRFEDPSGLLVWAAVDRGVLTLSEPAAFERHSATIASLVTAWISATRG